MPQPRISSQSSPSPKRISPLSRRHWMSTSSDGSVNGKNDGRKRILTLIDLEERLAEFLENPFQVAEMRALVDHQALDLVEHRRVRLVGVAAIGAAGNDDADRRLLRSAWCAPAPATCACAASSREPSGFGLKKNVSCISRAGWSAREIELGEIVVVGLDVGAFGDGKTHIGENRGQFVDHLADRVDAADLGRRFAHRQRDVDALGAEPRVERRALERLAARTSAALT